MIEDMGASVPDRATQATPQAPTGLDHSVSVPCAVITEADRALFRELERFVFQGYSGAGFDGEAIEIIAAHREAESNLIRDAWGALNFILAFYEPGQRYLDTNAWTNCEANARAVHARLAQAMETRRAETQAPSRSDDSAVAESDAPIPSPKDIPDSKEG